MEAIGFVVNPIAGMGGRVGLKGTDGVVTEARERGASPRAPARAREAMAALAERQPELSVYTAAGVMGEDAAEAAGYDPTVVYDPRAHREGTDPLTEPVETTADDTRETVRRVLERDVDLLLFVGGDGTAVDVGAVIDTDGPPMLGVPAGVKVYSSVFGVTPAAAGRIAGTFERVERREVNDIDETAYREGMVTTTLEAVVETPVAPEVQAGKHRGGGDVSSLAAGIARDIDPDTTYVFGPGGTVGAIQEELDMEPSPLGVDVWRDGTVLATDATADELRSVIEPPTVIVVSPIGGQGFLFGRGNQQIAPDVIRRADEIMVVATERKLDALEMLRVDLDDEAVNESLRGWRRVRTGRFTTRLLKVI